MLEDAAELFANAGDKAEAGAALRESLVIATQLGAGWCVARAERRLRPYGVRRAEVLPQLGRMSAVELNVADLVAAGWPDSDIAGRLALPRRTVSEYVQRVQEVLGVTTRLEVTRLAVNAHRAAQPSAISFQRSAFGSGSG